MKTSNKIVLGMLITVITIIFGLFITIRIIMSVNDDSDDRDRDVSEVSEVFNYKNFDKILMEAGPWDVTIVQSESYFIEVLYSSSFRDNIIVDEKEDNTLVMSFKGNYFFSNKKHVLQAKIGMPTIASITGSGSGDYYIEGFDQQEIKLDFSGSVDMDSHNCSVDRLNVILSGSGELDLQGIQAKNAYIEISGSGDIDLFMDGGTLSGSISGAGNISYSGTISEIDVDTSGAGKVEKRE